MGPPIHWTLPPQHRSPASSHGAHSHSVSMLGIRSRSQLCGAVVVMDTPSNKPYGRTCQVSCTVMLGSALHRDRASWSLPPFQSVCHLDPGPVQEIRLKCSCLSNLDPVYDPVQQEREGYDSVAARVFDIPLSMKCPDMCQTKSSDQPVVPSFSE